MPTEQQVIGFVDRLVPAAFFDQHKGGINVLTRARFTACLIAAFSAIVVLLFFIFFVLHIFLASNFTAALVALGVAALVLLAQYCLFYFSGSLTFTAMIFSITFFISTLSAVSFTGGWNSPVKLLLFCAPMISFIIAGRQEGLYTSALVVLSGLALLFLETQGFHFMQIMQPENLRYTEGAIWIMSCIILISCLAIYDGMLEALGKGSSGHIRQTNAKGTSK